MPRPATDTADTAPEAVLGDPGPSGGPVNGLPFDAWVHMGDGRYELVPVGAPWPTNTRKEG